MSKKATKAPEAAVAAVEPELMSPDHPLTGWQPDASGTGREEVDHTQGYTNLVHCQHLGCTAHRWVKSSDLFQVKFCREHQITHSRILRNEARKRRVKAKKPLPTVQESLKAAWKAVDAALSRMEGEGITADNVERYEYIVTTADDLTFLINKGEDN